MSKHTSLYPISGCDGGGNLRRRGVVLSINLLDVIHGAFALVYTAHVLDGDVISEELVAGDDVLVIKHGG